MGVVVRKGEVHGNRVKDGKLLTLVPLWDFLGRNSQNEESPTHDSEDVPPPWQNWHSPG